MSFSGDYTPEVPATRLEDREVEQLLSRSAEVSDDLADLEEFISVMSGETEAPRDVQHMATSLAAVARASGRPRRNGFRRLAILTASMAILFAFSGIAMAADGASPGDALYGLDTALETIGIGAGGVDERIDEFDTLLDGGSEGEAYAFLAEYIGSSDAESASIAAEHLVLVVTDGAPNADDAQEKVAAILAFIEANQGEGNGLDGRDFGQGVAAIARGETEEPVEPSSGTEPDSNGQGQGSGARPEDPGPPEETPAAPSNDSGEQPGQQGDPGQPEDTGPPEDAGPSDEAGVPDDPGPPDDKGKPEGSTPGTSPGATAPGATSPESGTSNGNAQGDGGGAGNGNAQGKGNGQGNSG